MKSHRWLMICWLACLLPAPAWHRADAQEPKKADASAAGAVDTSVTPTDGDGFRKRGHAFRLKGDFDHAIADFSEAIRLNPKDKEAYDERAWLDLSSHDYDKALADSGAAIGLDPKYTDAYLARAFINMTLKNYDAVMKDCDTMKQLDPKMEMAYHIPAIVYMKKGDLENALKSYDDLLGADPKAVMGLSGRAVVLMAEKKNEAALKAADELLRVDPKNANGHELRAAILLEQGDHSAALKDLSQATEDDPKNTEYAAVLAWTLATAPDAKDRDGVRAVKLATHVCEMTEWKDGKSLTALAAAEAETGNFKEAVKYQTAAIEARKDEDQSAKERLQKNLALYQGGKPYHDEKKKDPGN